MQVDLKEIVDTVRKEIDSEKFYEIWWRDDVIDAVQDVIMDKLVVENNCKECEECCHDCDAFKEILDIFGDDVLEPCGEDCRRCLGIIVDCK
jgi:hypothetical protein